MAQFQGATLGRLPGSEVVACNWKVTPRHSSRSITSGTSISVGAPPLSTTGALWDSCPTGAAGWSPLWPVPPGRRVAWTAGTTGACLVMLALRTSRVAECALDQHGVLGVPEPDHAGRSIGLPVHHLLATGSEHHPVRLGSLRPRDWDGDALPRAVAGTTRPLRPDHGRGHTEHGADAAFPRFPGDAGRHHTIRNGGSGTSTSRLTEASARSEYRGAGGAVAPLGLRRALSHAGQVDARRRRRGPVPSPHPDLRCRCR